MEYWHLALLLMGVGLPGSAADNGIVNKPSNHSVDETVERLKNILQSKGITVFALIDHSGEAEKRRRWQ